MKTLYLGWLMLNVSILFAQSDLPEGYKGFGYLDSIGQRLSIFPNAGFFNQQNPSPCTPPVLLPVFRDTPGFQDSALLPKDVIVQNPVVPPMEKTEGDINIYWIHGLNGSVESWALPANATEYGAPNFPARKAHCILGGLGQFVGSAYSENFGISYAADNWDAIGDQQPRHTNFDFVIAHSQGGIVAREWLRQMDDEPITHEQYAHGMVTFGSPHGGAMILNNTRKELKNNTPKFFNEACLSLSSALIIPKINESFITSLLISDPMREMILANGCKITSNNLIPLVIDNYHKRTTLDYYVGSPFMTGYNTSTGHVQGLSEDQINVPVVQFYGVEEEPVMWRFMASQLNMGDNVYGNPNLYFAYDKDDQLILKVNEMVDEFTADYQYESTLYDEWSKVNCLGLVLITGGVSVPVYAACKIVKEKKLKEKRENMAAYNKAIVWLSNANEYYKAMLVGSKIEHRTQYCLVERKATCRDPNVNPLGSGIPAKYVYSLNEYLAGSMGCNNGVNRPVTYTSYGYGVCTGTETVTTTYRVSYENKGNDGVVLAESASARLNVNPNYTHHIVIMEHTNHDQMKNSEATRQSLKKLFDGEYGSRFQIELR